MKKLIFTAVVVLIATVVLQAQPQGRGGRPDPKKMTERAADHLKFDDAQKAKLTDLNEKYKGDDYDRKKYHEEFRAIMTDEQRKQADEMRKNRGDRGAGREGRRRQE